MQGGFGIIERRGAYENDERRAFSQQSRKKTLFYDAKYVFNDAVYIFYDAKYIFCIVE